MYIIWERILICQLTITVEETDQRMPFLLSVESENWLPHLYESLCEGYLPGVSGSLLVAETKNRWKLIVTLLHEILATLKN